MVTTLGSTGGVALGTGSGGTVVGTSLAGSSRVAGLMTFRSDLRSSTVASIVRQRTALFGGANTFLQRVITMRINPRSVKWNQPKRISKKDTRRGSTYFHFNNVNGQNNDILVLSFTGSTGNIDQRGSLPNSATGLTQAGATDAQAKLVAWHNLYLMTREPMLLADGSTNNFSIFYSTPLFPVPILFNGFFSKILEFEETAQKPHSRDYSFDFTVLSSSPPLDNYLFLLGGGTYSAPNPVVAPSIGTLPATVVGPPASLAPNFVGPT